MIVAHCEDENLLRAGKRLFPDATANEHHLVRSAEAEIESVRTSIELVRETGRGAPRLPRLDARRDELMRGRAAEGLPVSGSTGRTTSCSPTRTRRASRTSSR